MNRSSGKTTQYLFKSACVLDSSQVCLRRNLPLQHISKHIKAASCGAGRHGGSVNGWACEQQVIIAVELRPLIGVISC